MKPDLLSPGLETGKNASAFRDFVRGAVRLFRVILGERKKKLKMCTFVSDPVADSFGWQLIPPSRGCTG